jgi:hypothetical protein
VELERENSSIFYATSGAMERNVLRTGEFNPGEESSGYIPFEMSPELLQVPADEYRLVIKDPQGTDSKVYFKLLTSQKDIDKQEASAEQNIEASIKEIRAEFTRINENITAMAQKKIGDNTYYYNEAGYLKKAIVKSGGSVTEYYYTDAGSVFFALLISASRAELRFYFEGQKMIRLIKSNKEIVNWPTGYQDKNFLYWEKRMLERAESLYAQYGKKR